MALPEHIISAIQNHNQPTPLNFRGAGLGDSDIDELVNLINANDKIVAVNLDNNNFKSNGIKKLVLLKNVHSLNVSRLSHLDDDAAITLVRAKQFTKLDISGNFCVTDVAGDVMRNEALQIYINFDLTKISEPVKKDIISRINKNYTEALEHKAQVSQSSTQNSSSLSKNNIFTTEPSEEIKEKPKYSPSDSPIIRSSK